MLAARSVPFRAGLARIPSVMLSGHKAATLRLAPRDSVRAAPALDIRALGIIVVGYVVVRRRTRPGYLKF